VPIQELKFYKYHSKFLGKTIYIHIPDRRRYTTLSQNHLENVNVNYIKKNSVLISRNHIEETKNLMSLRKENNSFFGKTPSDLELIRQKSLDIKHSEDTKLKINAVSGNNVNIYEKFSSEGFNLIGTFVSARRAGKLLDISGSSIKKYMNSGEIYKYRYKFSSK
jgi:group I intron endonuclease